MVVKAAAVGGYAVFITSAARFLVVKRLITSIPAGCVGRDLVLTSLQIQSETESKTKD